MGADQFPVGENGRHTGVDLQQTSWCGGLDPGCGVEVGLFLGMVNRTLKDLLDLEGT